jgi:hypothetical protein
VISPSTDIAYSPDNHVVAIKKTAILIRRFSRS